MASILDVALLQKFSLIFSMLFVFAIVYSILRVTEIMGENNNLNAIIAIAVALMLLFAPDVGQVITIMAPWFIMFIIFAMFILVWYKFLGGTDDKIRWGLNRYKIMIWIVIISAIILLAALGKVYFTPSEEDAAPQLRGGNETLIQPGEITDEPSEEAFWAVIFHPKVLGLIFVLLIATTAVSMLTNKVKVYT